MALKEGQFQFSITGPSDTGNGKQIIHQIPIHPPVAHLEQTPPLKSHRYPHTNQIWKENSEPPSSNQQLSTRFADHEYHQVFSPPSRPPTLNDVQDGVWGAHTSEKLTRASTIQECESHRSQDFKKESLPRSNTGPPSKRASDLGASITKAMTKGKEIGLDGNKAHLSAENLGLLVTLDNIRTTLPSISDDLIAFIDRNKKLFAITLLVISDESTRLRAMEQFSKLEFNDECLPVKNITKKGVCKCFDEDSDNDTVRSGESQQCQHNPKTDAFHDDTIWNWTNTKTFYEKQWSFLVQKFHEDQFEYHLSDFDILPIHDVVTENNGDEGHFSVVYKAMMLANYQDAIETNDTSIPVAIKELKQLIGKAYNVTLDWHNELAALSVFNKLGDGHIVKGIGAFKQRGKHYLIMEWADGGSLQQFWEKNPSPFLDLSGPRVMEILKQFRGLAHALSKMHNYCDPHEDYQTSPIPINAPGHTTDKRSWRHGDLKPSNILLFKDGSNWLGTCKIGDLGRAKEHVEKTGNRKSQTKEMFGTWRYEAPDVWTRNLAPRSRLYDIWSLGCVILDTVIWILYGATELKRFEEYVQEPHGSPYWTYESLNRKTAKIRENVLAMIQDMLLNKCRKPSALRDLIILVRDKLLVINISQDADFYVRGCRANSSTVCQELDAIISKANDDDSYLLNGVDLSSNRPPVFNRPAYKSDFLSPDQQLTPGNFATRKTSSPLVGRPDDSDSSSKNDSYVHDFDDTWAHEEDNSFARRVIKRSDIDFQALVPRKVSTLCDTCKNRDMVALDLKIDDTLTNLRENMQRGCEFCAIRLHAAENAQSDEEVIFEKVESGLSIKSAVGRLPVISICRVSGNEPRLDKGPNYIQIGFPKIPKAGSASHLGILRAWLEDCDANHPTCRPVLNDSNCIFPTRLVDVGSIDSPILRLVESTSLPSNDTAAFQYVALSHPWGDKDTHWHMTTTTANVDTHRRRIPDTLPATLADAVKVTRALSIRYIWIDSLCIIQGEGGDFAQEAERMETVFSSAHFVIAATSADGSTSGFLSRNSKREVDRQCEDGIVVIPCRTRSEFATGTIYVAPTFDNFQRDVREGPLNARGWVFQERALARRTIHFTDNQTYWECGHGIRCETLTKMSNKYEMFLGDPNFPSYGLRHRKGGDIAFYEFLYEQYSTLSFTRLEDRSVAICGLEQRLIRALKEKGQSGFGNFGLFDEYWGRGLLWQRASRKQQSAEGLEMIRLTSAAGGGPPAPSWSWMGHTGGITFMKHDPHSVEWLADEITFPWSNLKGPRPSTTAYRGDTCLRGIARDFHTPEGEDASIKLDIVYESPDLLVGRQQKCLIIGRMKKKNQPIQQIRHYVLILAPKGPLHRHDAYERVGAGSIHGSLIEFQESGKLCVSIE